MRPSSVGSSPDTGHPLQPGSPTRGVAGALCGWPNVVEHPRSRGELATNRQMDKIERRLGGDPARSSHLEGMPGGRSTSWRPATSSIGKRSSRTVRQGFQRVMRSRLWLTDPACCGNCGSAALLRYAPMTDRQYQGLPHQVSGFSSRTRGGNTDRSTGCGREGGWE